MPEGDTIHRAAARLDAALGGRRIELADAPDPRSPIHGRAGQLAGTTLERVEARGKHLLAHFSGGLVVHSHLGMNGRWRIRADGRLPYGRAWLLLGAGRGVAAQSGGKLLRLVSESRARNDPALMQLGPDPLRADYDRDEAIRRLRAAGEREVGDALLDQRVIAGVGNAIRNEALYLTGVSPWRPVSDLSTAQLESLVDETQAVMAESIRRGRRPRSIYRANRRGGCPRCGGEIRSRGQGDANRTAYWCPRCQS
jgi:endonuclease VIII